MNNSGAKDRVTLLYLLITLRTRCGAAPILQFIINFPPTIHKENLLLHCRKLYCNEIFLFVFQNMKMKCEDEEQRGTNFQIKMLKIKT